MTAYDVPEWTDFANTVAGGAAALAGLLFVGLSLNLSEVLKYPGVPARAVATLGLTVAILLTAIFVATPGQDHRVLAAEIALIGLDDGCHGHCRCAATAIRPAPGACALVDASAPRSDVAVDRRRGVVVAAAGWRPLLDNRCRRNGFRVRDGQRVGVAGRDQALAGAATRLATTTISGGSANSSASLAT